MPFFFYKIPSITLYNSWRIPCYVGINESRRIWNVGSTVSAAPATSQPSGTVQLSMYLSPPLLSTLQCIYLSFSDMALRHRLGSMAHQYNLHSSLDYSSLYE